MGYYETAKELEDKWEKLANMQLAMDTDYSIACEGDCVKKLSKEYWEQYEKIREDLDEVEEEIRKIWMIDRNAVSKEWNDIFSEQMNTEL